MDPVLLMKLQHAHQEPPETMTIEERVGALVQKLKPSDGPCGELPCNLAEQSGYGGFAFQLCELVQVTAKMTQLDSLCAKAAEATPPVENEEAKKWQELSMNAMQLSRQALVEHQKRCVQKLAEFSISPAPLVNMTAVKPATVAMPMAQQKHQKPQKAQKTHSNPKEVAKLQMEERGWNGTLRTHLSTLQDEDPLCVLIVRRINRLGFESDVALKEYFTKLGGVRHVLVAHSRVKPSAKRPQPRVRPAGIGFVVMGSQEETIKVLSSEEHVIRNVNVQVQRYETRCPVDEEEPQEEPQEEEDATSSSA
jgi:hypothetical protein